MYVYRVYSRFVGMYSFDHTFLKKIVEHAFIKVKRGSVQQPDANEAYSWPGRSLFLR